MNIFEKIAYDEEIVNITSNDLNQVLGDGYTPLLWAIKIRKRKNIKKLIDVGANVDVTDSFGNNIFHLVSENDDIETFNILEKSKKFPIIYRDLIEQKNKEGECSYHVACRECSHNIFKKYLEKMGPNIPDSKGFTPIFYAVANSDVVLAKCLFSNRQVDLNLKVNGKTVFDYAKEIGNKDMISLLEEAKNAPSKQTKPIKRPIKEPDEDNYSHRVNRKDDRWNVIRTPTESRGETKPTMEKNFNGHAGGGLGLQTRAHFGGRGNGTKLGTTQRKESGFNHRTSGVSASSIHIVVPSSPAKKNRGKKKMYR